MTNEDFALYVKQDGKGKDLQLENIVFQPYSFKVQGLTGRLDENRRRY